MNWTKLDLPEPLSYKEGNLYFFVNGLKNVKGTIMAEIRHFENKAIRKLTDLPTEVQSKLKNFIPA